MTKTKCGFCFVIIAVTCLSLDVFCMAGPISVPTCEGGGNCDSPKKSGSSGNEKDCEKCCLKKMKTCTKCVCSPKTTQDNNIGSTTIESTSTNLPTTYHLPVSTSVPDLKKNNQLSRNNTMNDEEDRVFSKDFIIGMITGALAVGIVVIATSITCYVCYSKNERMRREIIESYEKRYEKDGSIAMVGNEAYDGKDSLRGGFFSTSASTLRTSVPPGACYAEVDDEMLDSRLSHCSLPDVMEKVVDPTSGYAFYKTDRPSVYSGFHGHNARAKNTNHGLHRIDRPTIYTGLKRNQDKSQQENLSERVYFEAQEVLPERVLQQGDDNKRDPSHTYMKINDKIPTDQTQAETLPNASNSDTLPNTTPLPVYFQLNTTKDKEQHHYQLLEKSDEEKEVVGACFSETSSEYQSLGENIPEARRDDDRLPKYFTLDK
ncbi:uncharacterized protein [Antedon mediterranea]|uniref:uncharacterized protein isoform X2 n=1 Tax=Antedon mediterranea TaxID=105859 RepID=UPI003AF650CB